MRIGLGTILATALMGIVGCGPKGLPPRELPKPPVVTVSVPTRTSVPSVIDQPGQIEPYEQTPIYARISGYVRSVYVDIGARVSKGQVLAELDVPERVEEHHRKAALVEQARLGVGQAREAEQVAEANLVSTKAQIAVARAALGKATAALARWRSESERMDRLAADSVIDKQSRDETLNQYRAAEAAKNETVARITATEAAEAEARARLEKAKADHAAARNQVVVAQADEREARAMLEYTRIKAPFDGVIADRKVHTGHLVEASQGNTYGKPSLFVVVRMDWVRVFVEVPESDATRVSRKNVGRITVQALNDREFVGKVAGTSWSLDPSQRTLRTEIDFRNTDGMLRPGMYVHARLEVEHPDAWMIPAGAVLVRDGESFCYQVEDGRTRRLVLRPGLRCGNLLEVLKFQAPPLNPGERSRWVNPRGDERIVVSKPAELIENQQVEVEKEI